MRFAWIALLGLLLLVPAAVSAQPYDVPSNAALTGWLGATLDLQIVNPALTKRVSSSGTGLSEVETAVIGGLRLYARF